MVYPQSSTAAQHISYANVTAERSVPTGAVPAQTSGLGTCAGDHDATARPQRRPARAVSGPPLTVASLPFQNVTNRLPERSQTINKSLSICWAFHRFMLTGIERVERRRSVRQHLTNCKLLV